VSLVELRDGGVELRPFQTLYQKLRYSSAALQILRPNLPHLALLVVRLTPLRMRWPERVLWPFLLMLVQSNLGLRMPNLALLVREVLPGEADDL